MVTRNWRVACALVLLAIFGVARDVNAQTVTSQIGGTVVDAQKAIMPGVTISVRNTNTQGVRDGVTDAKGAFVITNLIPGTYDLKATLTGFKTYEQRGLVLTATERVSLPPITLDVGRLEESITVEASSIRVQTQSGERSAVISAEQIEDPACAVATSLAR